jgi:hypothetical protein
MTATKTTAEWLLKEDAAKLLGVATRQVERRARQGFIETKRLPRGINETTARVVYLRADLVAIKAGKPNVHAVAVSEKPEQSHDEYFTESRDLARKPESTTGAVALRPGSDDPFEALAAKLAGLASFAAQYAKPDVKPWLTLAEAVEYSGLPSHHLVEQARAGLIRAVNVGQGTREFWRFNREALAK